jgi:hypothetical protein
VIFQGNSPGESPYLWSEGEVFVCNFLPKIENVLPIFMELIYTVPAFPEVGLSKCLK